MTKRKIIKGVTKLEWVLHDGTTEQGMETDPSGTYYFRDDKGGIHERDREDMVSFRIVENPQSHKEIMEAFNFCPCDSQIEKQFTDCPLNN